MAKYRTGRINEAVAKELAIALREARDPGIAGELITVTRAEVSPDLKTARVFVSAMTEDKASEKAVFASLKRATPMFRRHLAQTLNLRVTPDLAFVPDYSIQHGARIAELLKQVSTEE